LKKAFLFLLLTIAFVAYSQQPVSIHLTEKDGLPDNEFYNILEDSKGYIWLAADKGLFRFDGTTYRKFQHTEQIGLSVFQLHEDINGSIWYTNLSNQVFYIKDEKITLFNNYSSEFKGSLTNLRLANNLLILSFREKIILINTETKKIVFKENNIYDESNLNLAPTIDKNSIYYGVSSDLVNLNTLNFQKKVTPFISKDKRFLQSSISNILGNNLVFFLSEEKGLSFYTINTKLNSKIKKLKDNFSTTRIVSAKVIDNKIWYGTKNGVYVCEVEKDSLVIKRRLFSNQFVTDVVKDKHANYWFTTVNNSIFIVPNIEINQVSVPLVGDKIKRTQIGKENELLISTLKPAIHKFSFPSDKIQSFNFKVNPEIFFSRFINNKYEVHTSTNMYEFNENFKNTNIVSGIGSVKNIKSINSNYSIRAYSNRIQIANIYNNKSIYQKKIRGNNVFYDAKNDLRYFATIKGLLVLDKELKEKEIKYKNKSIYINSITQTNDGILWCSSFKKGLFAIKDSKVIHHYTETEGLLSNTNRFIKATKNNIWIAGDNGIQYFNTTESTFKNLTKNEGIVSYNYNGLEIIDNNVFVSSPEQLIYFNEKEVFKTYNTPEVFFTAVSIDNKKQDLKSNYTLKEDASNVSINYSAIGFKTNASGQFEYRLLGFNDDWVQTKNGLTNVQYNNLLEGDYTFQIRNINTNIRASKTKQISFLVTKPFWQKWWFYAFLMLLLLVFISLFYRRLIHKKEKEKNKLLEQLKVNNELINLKLESLRSQMNPHFVFNALNSIQDYIISNQKNLAADYLGKFADLIRTYLDQSSKGKITIAEEIQTLNMYLELEKLRFEDKLSYKITTQKNLLDDDIFIPTVLIQPYVENALKHGLLHKKTAGNLFIDFSVTPEKESLIIVITDNGVGRKKSAELKLKLLKRHKSFATEATDKRLELLNYNKKHKIQLLVEDLNTNTVDVGTKVTIKIPI
jgi:ligand-binding sensor domain-containing protein